MYELIWFGGILQESIALRLLHSYGSLHLPRFIVSKKWRGKEVTFRIGRKHTRGTQLFKTKISDMKKLLALCWDKKGGAGPHQLRALGHNTDFI